MCRKTKFTRERTEVLLEFIREGYSITSACQGIGVARSTLYNWLEIYPDLNKAICEATDLQWKYNPDYVRMHKKRGYQRNLNRPSVNYESPGNVPFEMPDADSDILKKIKDEQWWRESLANAY